MTAKDLHYVAWMATQVIRGKPSHVEIEDLVQVGCVALLEASRDFDPSLGVRLWSYAQHRVRGAMLDSLRRDANRRTAQRHLREIDRAERSAVQRLGRAATLEELADEMGITLARLHEMQSVPWWEDAEPQTPYQQVAEREEADALWRAVERLPAQQHGVVVRYYGADLLGEEIADELGVSHSRISQILTQARDRLRCDLSVVP